MSTRRPPVRDERTRPPAPSRSSVRAQPVDAPAHPRIRARRVEVARDEGRRRRHRLNIGLGVLCAVVWAMVIGRSALLDVDRVQVSGAERTGVVEVVGASGVAVGHPMAELDLAQAADEVARLPWVDEVSVRRMWPGTVRVVVTERHPVGVARTAGEWALLDAEGRVLDVVPTRPDGLVAIEGSDRVAAGDVAAAPARRVLRAVDRLPSALRASLQGATHEGDGLVLALDGGWRVVVGDATDLRAKADAALAVRQAAGAADGCRIDVRVPTAPVLTGGGRCA